MQWFEMPRIGDVSHQGSLIDFNLSLVFSEQSMRIPYYICMMYLLRLSTPRGQGGVVCVYLHSVLG